MRRISDWRRGERVPLERFVVQLRGRSWMVRGDLSAGGVGFSVREAVREGEELFVVLHLPELAEPMVVRATVRHFSARGPNLFWVGSGFVGLDPLFVGPLERFVHELALASVVRAAGVR